MHLSRGNKESEPRRKKHGVCLWSSDWKQGAQELIGVMNLNWGMLSGAVRSLDAWNLLLSKFNQSESELSNPFQFMLKAAEILLETAVHQTSPSTGT